MAVLYRGIAVAPDQVDEVVAAIRSSGELAAGGFWKNEMARPSDVRSLSALLALTPQNIRDAISALEQTPLTYACGDFEGAARYALSGRGIPLVIGFDLPLENLIVDGKDFLYTAFQLWDRSGTGHRNYVRDRLSDLFGEAILPWFDKACTESENMARIGWCDLAVHDIAVVEAHYLNQTVIEGRSERIFRSAFALPARVEPDCIHVIQIIEGPPPAHVGSVHLGRHILDVGSAHPPQSRVTR